MDLKSKKEIDVSALASKNTLGAKKESAKSKRQKTRGSPWRTLDGAFFLHVFLRIAKKKTLVQNDSKYVRK